MIKCKSQISSPVVRPALILIAFTFLANLVFAQTSTTGAVNISVVDSSGAVVPDAKLELINTETNDPRPGATQGNGVFQFQGLTFGTYRLTISKAGFEDIRFDDVKVEVSRVTDIKATLTIGRTATKVEVSEESPVVETTSSALATTIDTKQVVNLPVAGRSVMSLAFLVPGWTSNGNSSTNGTWNNMPGGAVVSADFDGTPGISNRFRSGGFNYGTTAPTPRLENVGEMTISTAQLDLSGPGTSAMRISIVSRHGANNIHGALYEDFRNTDLNANYWRNNALNLPRTIQKLNDFGGSIGGPIKKNKAFFFGTWAQSTQPLSNIGTASVLSASAQQGIFSYKNSAGAVQTLNLFNLVAGKGPTTVLPSVSTELSKINSVVGQGSLSTTSDPNINTLTFLAPGKTNVYYPNIRVDYNATDSLRFYATFAETRTSNNHTNLPLFPGGIDPTDYVSGRGDNKIGGFGIDWTVRPTLVNSFHAGYLYQYSGFDIENQGIDLTSISRQNFGYGTGLYGGAYPRLPISSFYPMLSANDSLTWQHDKHSFVFGGSWFQEHDHYWNGPGGFPSYSFGIVGQDPLSTVFSTSVLGSSSTNLTNAENLYAELVGRISAVSIATGRPLDPATKTYKPYGQYNLNEVQSSAGVWFQDSWRVRQDLTINYGLRWDFVGDDHDINGGYSTLASVGDLWGPTPVGAMNQPGVLGGVANPQFQAQVHVYAPSYMNPSPAIGIAWNPKGDESSIIGKLLGKNTVIRTGYSLRHYQEGAQNFWAFASNSGQFFYQSGTLTSNPTTALGNFTPGSLTLGNSLPPYFLSPAVYSSTVPASQLFPGTFYGINRAIQQPYVEQWNFGIERAIGNNNSLSVRYVGNLSLHQWLAYDINQVNIYENGFLNEFKNAQGNLARNGGTSFANMPGVAGDVPLPIISAAFGSTTGSNFTNGTYITNLKTGAAGAMANSLASNTTFYCNLVGTAAFPACASKVGSVAGAGYPINFWQVNPFASGRSVNYLDSAGSSNYNGLQVEFKQRLTKGAQFNVNYVWAHALGIASQDGIQGQNSLIYYTDRNFRLNYGPSLFDIRHTIHASGTYDLPFGKGRKFMNSNRLLDSVFGGWTLGTIAVFQTGTPIQLAGGYSTVNGNDSGLTLSGVTTAQIQSAIGVYRTGNPWVSIINPSFVASNGAASSALAPDTAAGQLGFRPYVYGPHWFNDDLSVVKAIPITERIHLVIQAELLNVFNHPTFGIVNGGQNAPENVSVQSLTFGQIAPTSDGRLGPTGPRQIELRANITF